MKECTYCGHQNEDNAATCTGCGTGEFKTKAAEATEDHAAPDKQEEFVTLDSTPTLAEADLMIGRLEAAGIEASILNEQSMQTLNLNLGFFRVQVRRKDLANAKEFLAAPASGS